MRFPETLWVAGSSPAGGANTQVNDMLTNGSRTISARCNTYSTLTARRWVR